jgi:flagellar basal-body rod modification protein FlgD
MGTGAVSNSLSSLIGKTKEAYTAKASLNDDGSINTATSTVTGDRTTDLFKGAEKEMGKDQFLQLLVTQLRYQDPLNPMENTEFVSQLAQFRSLESSSNIETAIGKLGDTFKGTVDAQSKSAESISNSSAISMIGKTVRLEQKQLNWVAKAGNKEDLNIHLGNATEATVRIVNSDGETVKTLKASQKDEENSQTISWDGLTDFGEYAKSGKYTVEIDEAKNNSEIYAFVQDTITGVRFTKDGTVVKISGKELPLSNVLDVSGGSSGSESMLSPQTAISMIGKTIRVKSDAVRITGADRESVPISINTGGREKVSVQIADKLGNIVYTTTVQAGTDGVADFGWNGSSNGGGYAKPGEYFISISGQGQDPSLYSFAEGVVSGVMNLGAETRLRVGSISVGIKDIIDVSDTVKSTDQGGTV